jgi:hypothetical protein
MSAASFTQPLATRNAAALQAEQRRRNSQRRLRSATADQPAVEPTRAVFCFGSALACGRAANTGRNALIAAAPVGRGGRWEAVQVRGGGGGWRATVPSALLSTAAPRVEAAWGVEGSGVWRGPTSKAHLLLSGKSATRGRCAAPPPARGDPIHDRRLHETSLRLQFGVFRASTISAYARGMGDGWWWWWAAAEWLPNHTPQTTHDAPRPPRPRPRPPR